MRRALLAAVGTAASIGAAGCFGSGDGSGTNESDSTSGGANGNESSSDGTTDGTDDSSSDGDDSSTDGSGDSSTDDSDDASTDDSDDSSNDDTDDSSETTPATVNEGGPPGEDWWELTLESTFEDGSRDRNHWSLGSGYGLDCPGGGLECWEEDNVWVDEETNRLVIETTDEPSGDREYTSAAISTRVAFEQEFGYFEAKSRPPAQPGAQPAFWAWWNSDDWTYRREIDVCEIFGDDATTAVHSVHTMCEPQEDGQPTEWKGGESTLETPADETFHVWGVEWSPDAVTFYVDGEEVVHREDDFIGNCLAGEAMGILCSSHVNGDMGDPTEAEYPYTHEFDWVRVWQHEDWE